MANWTLESLGPDAVMLRFGEAIEPDLVPVIRAATERLEQGLKGEIRDLVPSYTTLMVCYDPLQNDTESVTRKIAGRLQNLEAGAASEGQQVEIPVYYHPEVGPDLARVAEHHRVSIDEVIRRHTASEYRVFAIGFAPGFAYMGNVADNLATPRLETPRRMVPTGSVALADQQTAVYPLATPGGWNLLGRTAVKMFDRDRVNLCPVNTGDRVRFVTISRAEFLDAGGELA